MRFSDVSPVPVDNSEYPGFALRRSVFIKPVFVKSELFVGKLSDTNVLMKD